MSLFNRRTGRDAQQPGDGGFNTGVQNSGTMGNVQNQPGASNSQQHQANTDPAAEARLAETLDALGAALTLERAQLTDPEQCRALLDLVRQQELTEDRGRAVAQSMLGQLADRCGGAPGVASLTASALTMLSTAIS